jgi:hypothetical protein
MSVIRAGVFASIVLTLAATSAQQAPPGQPPRGSGGPPGAQPLNLDDRSGFQSIFDGTMKNWDGDTTYWRAENGSLVGETSEANKLSENTFVIWRGGEPADFELKLEFRMNATNSGIQFRSQRLPPGTMDGDRAVQGKWVLKGYQADIDFANQWTGQIYEERGRGFLAMRGQAVYVPDGGRPKVIGNLQQSADELKAIIKANDWNQVHLIARGNTIVQILNGAVTSIVVDDDTKNRALGGLLGFQIRNIWLKTL